MKATASRVGKKKRETTSKKIKPYFIQNLLVIVITIMILSK